MCVNSVSLNEFVNEFKPAAFSRFATLRQARSCFIRNLLTNSLVCETIGFTSFLDWSKYVHQVLHIRLNRRTHVWYNIYEGKVLHLISLLGEDCYSFTNCEVPQYFEVLTRKVSIYELSNGAHHRAYFENTSTDWSCLELNSKHFLCQKSRFSNFSKLCSHIRTSKTFLLSIIKF